jgi:hypothetical protein
MHSFTHTNFNTILLLVKNQQWEKEVTMKSIMFLFLALPVFLCPKFNIAQPQYYVEQNSGVTTNLTSVCMTSIDFSFYQVWACGDSGTIVKTSNNGDNWFNVSGNGIPSNVNLVNISCKAVDTALTAGNIGTSTFVYRTSNGGTNWTQVFTQTNGYVDAIWMKNALLGFMVGNPVSGRWSLWKTTNGGVNWDSTGLYLQQSASETGWRNSLTVFNNSIWFGTNNSRLYFTSNYGANWTALSTAPEINSSAVWVCSMDSSKLYMGGSNAYFSFTGGVSWELVPCPGAGNFNGFCGGILGVANNGNNYPQPLWAIRGNSNVYVIDWSPNPEYTAPSGNYNHMATDYFYRYYYVSQPYTWIVRSNGGITRNSLFRGGAVRTISTVIPEAYSLKQNFPNPFNPTTKVRFNLPKTAFVTIKVYDILGREVSTIVNEELHAGEYEASYDAGSLSSGIYYYRLDAGDYSGVKKMILIK